MTRVTTALAVTWGAHRTASNRSVQQGLGGTCVCAVRPPLPWTGQFRELDEGRNPLLALTPGGEADEAEVGAWAVPGALAERRMSSFWVRRR